MGKKKKTRSLGVRIALTMMSVVAAILLCIGVVFTISTSNVSDMLMESNRELIRASNRHSSASMIEVTQTRLQELAQGKADLADALFMEFRSAVAYAAEAAAQIYAHPEKYEQMMPSVPDASNEGKLTPQILYSASVNPDDPAIRQEAALIGNVQDTLYSINNNFDSMASNYIASESGFMIQTDYISAEKFDESGAILPLEARERPWYVGAKETGEAFFTPLIKDAHTPKQVLCCGVPIYVDGEFKGVSGAGIYLDSIEKLVESVEGSSGDALIINQEGQILFSTKAVGALAASDDGADLRDSESRELAVLASRACEGGNNVELIEVDGILQYVAYSPMKTIGWSFLIVLPQKEVEAPTLELKDTLNELTSQIASNITGRISTIRVLLLFLFLVAVLVALLISMILSKRIVEPIRVLTEDVKKLEGDNLDFKWELNTGDETQVLANSFQSLTERMKAYIEDIQTITSEKERIETELGLAAKIQADMLPGTFPPFPDRTDFDIFASMTPAKEVGGDFYDFYLVDDDHLCLVMADVCGKGVPAALFMMASKIILANNAMMGRSPAKILEDVNAAICSNNKEDMFVTVWLGILELSTGKLRAANAGHEYPILKRKDGSFEIIKDPHGFVVGGMDGEIYDEYEWQLMPGDKLFVYTDGVPEAMTAGRELFGMERLVDTLNEVPDANPREILQHMKDSVDAFVGSAPQFDDLTMLCMEFKAFHQKPAASLAAEETE
ncbi:MAG: SpoIIE family protein phosphatase [Firmicutes bacterium]|nr:SpoIIE family protein phosphatase [Bacillota bacterium]